ncbi:hypothetical protein DFP72DRAFT_1179972 [Ephemerocybe angulata]|uniref:Uncharacterized protein n=1 Tax=Ephemerocybe angulata TaxID=980116 RepID=A0A8H6H7E0_9AGAR|nr:hypothetical protein DFP72DRAFT_1179972 [Tulosesus angulatus]
MAFQVTSINIKVSNTGVLSAQCCKILGTSADIPESTLDLNNYLGNHKRPLGLRVTLTTKANVKNDDELDLGKYVANENGALKVGRPHLGMRIMEGISAALAPSQS